MVQGGGGGLFLEQGKGRITRMKALSKSQEKCENVRTVVTQTD